MTSNMKESICERDRKLMFRMLSFRLPRYFFATGIILFIAAFIYMILHKALDIQHEYFRVIARNVMVLALLFCSLARERHEDERTRTIRAQSYSLAFIFGVVYAILQPFLDYGIDRITRDQAEFKDDGVIGILIYMLFIQLAFFQVFKKNI